MTDRYFAFLIPCRVSQFNPETHRDGRELDRENKSKVNIISTSKRVTTTKNLLRIPCRKKKKKRTKKKNKTYTRDI